MNDVHKPAATSIFPEKLEVKGFDRIVSPSSFKSNKNRYASTGRVNSIQHRPDTYVNISKYCINHADHAGDSNAPCALNVTLPAHNQLISNNYNKMQSRQSPNILSEPGPQNDYSNKSNIRIVKMKLPTTSILNTQQTDGSISQKAASPKSSRAHKIEMM